MDWLPELAWDVQWISLFVFAFISILQLFYYWYYFSRLAFYRPRSKETFHGPVSVVMCARNEYENLVKNLPLLLNQDFQNFEVVVVDDASDDDTPQYLQQMKGLHDRLQVITLRESVNFFKGKKLALSVGIKSAKHDVLLLTDADCKPSGPHWITRMVDNYHGDVEVVLGYGGYEPRPGLLNKLIRYDTLYVALQYLSLALARKPYMGVGRNLSYKKELFFRMKGFTSHYKIMSGDDDLFINQAANRRNVAIEVSPHSHTFSSTKNSFRDWLRQKRRHLTTGKYYKPNQKRLLGLLSLSHFFYYPGLAFVIVFNGLSVISGFAAVLFLFRFISHLIIFSKITGMFNERKLLRFSPIFDLLHPFINSIFVLASLFYTKQTWK